MDFTLLLILLTLLSGILFLILKVTTTYLQNNPIVDFISSLFPILAFVLIFRSFVIEPYRIPSGSMIPNLVVGDFILVKKYEYGVDKVPSDKKKDYDNIIGHT